MHFRVFFFSFYENSFRKLIFIQAIGISESEKSTEEKSFGKVYFPEKEFSFPRFKKLSGCLIFGSAMKSFRLPCFIIPWLAVCLTKQLKEVGFCRTKENSFTPIQTILKKISSTRKGERKLLVFITHEYFTNKSNEEGKSFAFALLIFNVCESSWDFFQS